MVTAYSLFEFSRNANIPYIPPCGELDFLTLKELGHKIDFKYFDIKLTYPGLSKGCGRLEKLIWRTFCQIQTNYFSISLSIDDAPNFKIKVFLQVNPQLGWLDVSGVRWAHFFLAK